MKNKPIIILSSIMLTFTLFSNNSYSKSMDTLNPNLHNEPITSSNVDSVSKNIKKSNKEDTKLAETNKSNEKPIPAFVTSKDKAKDEVPINVNSKKQKNKMIVKNIHRQLKLLKKLW
ncbi:MAG: hypothetical protein GX982_05560 [Tissierellia bacterium]|nr:hypothetical protein [Tissierellia bacterium]